MPPFFFQNKGSRLKMRLLGSGLDSCGWGVGSSGGTLFNLLFNDAVIIATILCQ
jgi:hypothetical protein